MRDPVEEDTRWMRRALRLADATIGLASPNPTVGCVLVRDGVVLGEGAHRYDAFDHAEIVALKEAKARVVDVAGTTAYVTLEPCSHHGRTGPCADALVAAKVSRVVAATIDPNPQVSGRGMARMRAAGIEVAVGVCEAEARALNDGFATYIRTGRPMVTLKAALSRDGKLAPAATARVPRETFWITGPEARAEVQRMRHAADAVLTGIGTVLADDPLLTDRSGGARRRPLLRMVLDSFARTQASSRLVASAAGDVVVFCGDEAPFERALALKGAGITVERVTHVGGQLVLGEVLDRLGRRGLLNLLLECGSELNGAFLRAGLVDKVVLFHAEQELGASAIPFAAGFVSPAQIESELIRVSRETVGPDVRVSGYRRDPWT